MSIELRDIRGIRKKLELSQKELAKKAGVSQSLIAKIESGMLDPGYSKTKQIIDALSEIGGGKELLAKDVMSRKVRVVAHNEKLQDIILVMKRYAISQVPVTQDGKILGLITESLVLDKVMEGANSRQLKAQDVVVDCPPVVSPCARVSVLSSLLRHYPLVIVALKGEIVGVVTKADIIEKMV